eukprot:scaffold3134_cov111-Skeletonema_menzelii.AAC.5
MWTKKTPLAALLLIIARFGPGVEAKVRSPKSSKIPTSKAGKKVCLEYAFLTDVVVKGSATPIAGPTGLSGCTSLPPSGVCCTEGAACALGSPDACDAYSACLRDPANGPVVVGDWWFNRDVTDSSFRFEEGKVCAGISSDASNDSKTSMELWDQDSLGERLDRFREFKVDYDIVNSGNGGSVAFVNFYVRAQPGRSIYYDCNFVFRAPDVSTGAQGTISIDLDTPSDSARKCTATYCTPPGPIDDGCVDNNSINDYLTDNPNAVFGVGNNEWYTFVLTNGSTGQDNDDLDVCWSDVSFTRVDEAGTKIINTFEFTSLN